MNIMNKIVLLNNKLNTDKINLFLINKVAEIYNNMLYMYTKNFKGRTLVPKTDISKILKNIFQLIQSINCKLYGVRDYAKLECEIDNSRYSFENLVCADFSESGETMAC